MIVPLLLQIQFQTAGLMPHSSSLRHPLTSHNIPHQMPFMNRVQNKLTRRVCGTDNKSTRNIYSFKKNQTRVFPKFSCDTAETCNPGKCHVHVWNFWFFIWEFQE